MTKFTLTSKAKRTPLYYNYEYGIIERTEDEIEMHSRIMFVLENTAAVGKNRKWIPQNNRPSVGGEDRIFWNDETSEWYFQDSNHGTYYGSISTLENEKNILETTFLYEDLYGQEYYIKPIPVYE